MKCLNRVIILKVLLIFIVSGVFSSSNYLSAQTLKNDSWWRMQYNEITNKQSSLAFAFRGNNILSGLITNQKTGVISQSEGLYVETKDSLYMQFDKTYLVFSLKWINKNKVKLLTKGFVLYMSVFESKEDTYDYDYKKANP